VSPRVTARHLEGRTDRVPGPDLPNHQEPPFGAGVHFPTPVTCRMPTTRCGGRVALAAQRAKQSRHRGIFTSKSCKSAEYLFTPTCSTGTGQPLPVTTRRDLSRAIRQGELTGHSGDRR
jgi:hypothetical protein